jgi:hypothetical protein
LLPPTVTFLQAQQQYEVLRGEIEAKLGLSIPKILGALHGEAMELNLGPAVSRQGGQHNQQAIKFGLARFGRDYLCPCTSYYW